MKKETFKTIPSFTDYLISNFGRVKTKARKVRYVHAVTGKEQFRQSEERFLKIFSNANTGYKIVCLYKNKKAHHKSIHRMVAEVFIKNPKKLGFVNHKDGNKHNNIVENLEWCTNEYNHEHATKTGLKPSGERVASSKLNNHCVYAIKWFLKEGYSHNKIATIFKISRATISLIAEGKTWKHRPPNRI